MFLHSFRYEFLRHRENQFGIFVGQRVGDLPKLAHSRAYPV
jgi:hypothetical protein